MVSRASSNPNSPAKCPEKWRRLLALLPGYDCWKTAAPGDWFDADAAELAVSFFHECLTHIEGAMAGKPFKLEPWQQAIVGALFGWKRRDGTRRYREALIFVPRKNGKTPLVAGIACFVFFCDQEAGQQNVLAAGEREQASLLFRHMSGMIANEPALSSQCTVFGAGGGSVTRAITKPDNSATKVISADADTKHGGNLHLAVIDELHVQPNRDLADVLRTSTASLNRRQPLLIHVTTSDYERISICNETHDHACSVRDGVIADPAFLPVVYQAEIDDDWKSEKVWAKANPNLGVSVSLDYLRRECQKAVDTPGYQNTFCRLHLNIRTEQDRRWLSLDKWDACADGVMPLAELEKMLAGRECIGALDLSSKVDLSCWGVVFPPTAEDKRYHVLPRFYIPRENMLVRERQDRVPFSQWVREGWITATDGNAIDYDFIKAKVREDAKRFNLREVAYDTWNATQIAIQLQNEGVEMVEFSQQFRAMSEPAKELEKLILEKRIAHYGNPVMRWMVSLVAKEQDSSGNIKPSKKKSNDRIDGIVTMIMALGRDMVAPGAKRSKYETQDLIQV